MIYLLLVSKLKNLNLLEIEEKVHQNRDSIAPRDFPQCSSLNKINECKNPQEVVTAESKPVNIGIPLQHISPGTLEDLSMEIQTPNRMKHAKVLPQSFRAATTPNTKIKGYASHVFSSYIDSTNSKNSER